MSIFAAISFVSFIVLVILAAAVLVRNPKSPVNRICALMLGLYALLTFIEFGYRHAKTEEQAQFWWSIDVIWPIALVSIFYFELFFTKQTKLLKKWFLHVAVLGPAVTAVLFEVFTDLITGPPARHSWGWAYTSPDTLVSKISYAWMILVAILGFTMTLAYRRRSNEPRTKKQAALVALIWLIAVAAFSYESLLQSTGLDIPPTIGLYWLIGGLITSYAIWRYDMFALSPITAAENIVAAMSDSLLLINNKLKIESANAAAQNLLEYDENELKGMDAVKIFDSSSPLPRWMSGEPSNDNNEKAIKYIDTRFRTKNGRRIPIWLSAAPLYDTDDYQLGYMMIGRDITERNRREQELRVFKKHLEQLVEKRTAELKDSVENLEKESKERERAEKESQTLQEERTALKEQLYHAQKLESIGRLAGGVAHDFNNLLFVINTYSEGFLQTFDTEEPLYADFKEIHQAALRATSLTQQLLAFSRKQFASPKEVDPNDAIHQIQRMITRLIGEHIRISIIPGINIGHIKIDPGQLDQIMMNLAVNSRDAMPSGGSILIETNRVFLSRTKIWDKEDIQPGPYVMIRFSDTGHGMDEETQKKIFDPFFSTKAPGKGTGLGLSTIYGIVKQNNGFIEVDSRIDEGTTFKIYLPKYTPDEEAVASDLKDKIGLTGSETILLVEDDDQVRRLAARLLGRLGYNVIEAAGAGEAARIFFESRNDIDLLFTDVVMPGMNGKQLSHLLNTTKPKLKVLFMSGYNEEISDKLGKVDNHANFIAKPFSSEDLSQKIRQVLDA